MAAGSAVASLAAEAGSSASEIAAKAGSPVAYDNDQLCASEDDLLYVWDVYFGNANLFHCGCSNPYADNYEFADPQVCLKPNRIQNLPNPKPGCMPSTEP